MPSYSDWHELHFAEPPAALDRYFAAEEARWRKVFQDAGIKIE